MKRRDKTSTRCVKCGRSMTGFRGYIPNMGESCMECYIAYMKDDENVLVATRGKDPSKKP